MSRAKYIKMDGASINVAHILSFESEKSFVEAYDSKLYQKHDARARKTMLRSIYKLAKKQSDELQKSDKNDIVEGEQ